MRLDRNLTRIYAYFLPYKVKLAFCVIFLAGTAGTMSLTAILLGRLADDGFYSEESDILLAAPLLLILVTVVFAVCSIMSAFLMADVSQAVLARLRGELFERVLHLPSPAYAERTEGEISSKFVNEAAIALAGAAQSFIVLVRDVAQTAALLFLLVRENFMLSLVSFIIVPALFIVMRLIARRIRRLTLSSQKSIAGMIGRIQETYDAASTVKVAGTAEFEDRRFDEVNCRIAALAVKLIKTSALSTPITQVLTMTAVAAVTGYALWQASLGLMTLGDFITFITALLLLKTPIQHLSGLNGTFASISAAAESIFSLLDAPTEKDGAESIPRAEGRIEFRDVTVCYPGAESAALENFSLTIEPGEHVALVGPSGAGKSTLANLIARFIEPTSGTVLLDGRDVRCLQLNDLRRQISFVSQPPLIQNASIRENVCCGLEASPEAIDRAIDAAGLTSLVKALPDGLETKAGENGSAFSGGECQRIAVARAFLKESPILILDEATSALDSENESLIRKSVENLMTDRTCITVAHRFSSIQSADRVVVMDKGRIVQTGTIASLLEEKNGLFFKLWSLQQISSGEAAR